MGKLLILLFQFTILNPQLFCNCEFIYTAIAPTNILPGSPFQISTTLESADETSTPVTFKYELTNKKNETVASSEDIQLSEPGNKVTVLKIKEELLVNESYNLTVTASDSRGNEERDRILIQRDIRNTAILIQTDKPIYKPGETVRFRVIVLSRFLLPFEEDKIVSVTVMDSGSNVIKIWKAKVIPSGRGFISEEFELSKEPNLGDWNIQVKTDQESDQETKSFSVEEYVLPKYKVEISVSPKFITYNESKFTAEVSVMYSYGKPVSGECTVELKDPYQYDFRPSISISSAETNQNDGPPPGITKTSKLEEGKGLVKIEFDPKSELNLRRHDVNEYGKEFEIFASCKDQSSGNVRNATKPIKMYQFPYSIQMINQPNHILPGFLVNVTIKVAYHDDVPVSDERPDALKIKHGFQFNEEDGIMLVPIPPNGLVQLSFMAATNPKICYESLDVTYKGLTESLWLPSKQVSPTGSYMQLKLMTKSPVEGQPIEINVKTNKGYQALNVFLISRGVILDSELVKGEGGKGQTFSAKLSPKSSPKAKLFVYVVFNDNSIVSDVLDLNVKMVVENKLKISLSEDSVEPGQNVTISVNGHPNSTVGLRAVDQSVLILKMDDDLTLEKLGNVAERFQAGDYNYWSAGEIFQNFIQNGLGLLTNLKIEKGEHRDHHPVALANTRMAGGMSIQAPAPHRRSGKYMRKMAAPEGVMSDDNDLRAGASGVEVRVRSFFPETWIWEDVENPGGNITIQKTVPDTITSWLISAFQMNQEHGLGLTTESQKLSVFRPFFVALNLPYSVVKGEILLLQVLVHNFMEKAVTAKVTLENQEESFKFLESEGTFDRMDKDVEVGPTAISSVVFPIVPSKFGIITLKVKAVTSEAGDAVSQTLIVRPPGIRHTQNSAVFVNLLTKEVFKMEKISATFPEQRVPDADFLKVQVIGDILGGTLNNLDKLIKLPTGCAEQNMLNFVPDVVILDYLNTTGQLMPEVEAKAKGYLEHGYQRQLSYLRYDGSYSIFGNSDQVGSTWLTAYTTRAFIQAKRHIHIDNHVIQKSLRFLLGQQNDNGSFSEEGFVIHRSLQGGDDGKKNHLAITAYTLLTIAEAQKAQVDLGSVLHRNDKVGNKSVEDVISSGVNFLIKQTSTKKGFSDVYSVNLIAYLLHYINHPQKDDYFKMIEEFSRVDKANGTIYWKEIERQKPTQPIQTFRYMIWQPRTSSATVEMTSYGLLTYLLRGEEELSDAVSIAKWLIKRRNSLGGFMSSQDTVMGITALAKFAEAVNTKENLDANVQVELSFGVNNKHPFYIGKDNRTVLQEYLLPGNTTEVSIKGSGKGIAVAQLTWTYYVEAVDLSPAFELKAKLIEHDQGRNLDMEIEFSYTRGGKSNMAILEAATPSGYAFDQEELESLKKDGMFKRYELEDKDSKVQLYFESVDKTPRTLFLKIYRIYLVAKHAQVAAKIYDYYDNTQAAQFMYEVPVISLCDICSADKSCELKECN